MEESESNTKDGDDNFFDALDEFPFYDSDDTDEHDQSISHSSSISQLEPVEATADVSPTPVHEITSPTGLRRRRSFSRHIRKDISGDDPKNSNPNPPVSSDVHQILDTTTTSTTTPRGRKYRFSRNVKENESKSENLDLCKVQFSSGRISEGTNEENKENSTVTTANNEKVGESSAVDSQAVEIEEMSSSFIFFLAGLVIKAIGFQLTLLFRIFTFPIWLIYCSFMLVIDPLRLVRCVRECLMGKLLRVGGVMCKSITPFMFEWFKEHKSTWMLAFRFGWGLLWSVYVCVILVGLLVSAFVVSGFMMTFMVEEPIQMEETLNFDYTKNSPVALVPIISCPDVFCGLHCMENIEVGKLGLARIIPANHKLQVTVSLTLPESDYNRNLGVFQVRVDFLSANGKALSSSRRPCMLQFKSQPIRLLLTFLKLAPVVTGYLSESQTLTIKFKGFTEGDMPTACLRVIIEQRAEYWPASGIPEIYAASLTLESELPLLKRILCSHGCIRNFLARLSVFEQVLSMDTRGKSDAEFRSEVSDALARQEASVEQVQAALQAVLTELQALQPETFLIGCFIAGLRDDIRLDVKIKQPRTLADAIGVSRLVEERNSLQKRTTPQGRILPVASMQRGSPNPAVGILGPPPTQRPGNISNPPTTPFRRISSQEARERREKGLCYYCDEKYSMGHRCERPQLFMIEDSPDVDEENSDANGQGAEVLDALPEISFHAIAGVEHPQTLIVWGRLKNKNLMVLIDGGSTHNFIDQATASRFGLYITRNKKLQVVLANQEKIECVGQCQGLTLTIQGVPITADYYVLPVAACQVVLGVQWLETLGPIEMDYKHLTMTFQVREISHTLHGLKRTAEAANIEALDSKECSGWQGMGVFFQIQISPIETSHSPDAYPEEIRSLLNRYSWVFEAPTGLPPQRLHDHRIPLQSNTGPVSVRPYQYPYYRSLSSDFGGFPGVPKALSPFLWSV
ncbi:hypothetical protein F0562_013956 [Nyssa sinensis]|uniref:Uncharacterized protein n=1 Tax=Nyssa sinensis TaxID=561372 RepID=A0A5J4ZNQ8_9ASTE|nr:hypothetical protein F0562_013956 [Nyssa sinensis]